MKNKIINTINLINLIIGILLTVLPTFLSTDNQIFQINLNTKTVQYITAAGILVILLSTIFFLLSSSLQRN